MDGKAAHSGGRVQLPEGDRQPKEQFIHGLNNKHMLEEIYKRADSD